MCGKIILHKNIENFHCCLLVPIISIPWFLWRNWITLKLPYTKILIKFSRDIYESSYRPPLQQALMNITMQRLVVRRRPYGAPLTASRCSNNLHKWEGKSNWLDTVWALKTIHLSVLLTLKIYHMLDDAQLIQEEKSWLFQKSLILKTYSSKSFQKTNAVIWFLHFVSVRDSTYWR